MEQMSFMYAHELIVDNFAGGGGASLGLEWAFGRCPDIAINHDPEAVAMHMANHPETRHYCEDVWQVDPVKAVNGRPVGFAWFSPDCKHFSKAKGGKPVSKKIRGLAWIVVKWARKVRPRVLMLENVEEFQDWGPLTFKRDDNGDYIIKDGNPVMVPCQDRRGQTFKRWKQELERLGYRVEYRQLRACDYGAPTIRKRLFLIARCDGLPIVWPESTHGDPNSTEVKRGKLQPWRTAAECIDFSLPTPSIFITKEEGKKLGVRRPLAENTMKRICRGIQRYVLDSAVKFIVTANHGGDSFREQGLRKPFKTITAVVTSHLLKLRGTCKDGQSNLEPMPTVTAGGLHVGEVRAFLIKYYGADQDPRLNEPMHTVTTKHRFGLVTVDGDDYVIADIGMRMLEPRELYRAQGFPDSYQIDIDVDGKRLSKSAQVRMCGNSVSPYMSYALAQANVGVKRSRKNLQEVA